MATPEEIELARQEFYEAIGGQNYVQTPSGAPRDVNFSRSVEFANRLEQLVQQNPRGDIENLARTAFEAVVPRGQYQQLNSGGVADVAFSQEVTFVNGLSEALQARRLQAALNR